MRQRGWTAPSCPRQLKELDKEESMNEDDAQREISSLKREINELKREIEQLKMFYDIPDIDTAISLKYVSRLFLHVFITISHWFCLLLFCVLPLYCVCWVCAVLASWAKTYW